MRGGIAKCLGWGSNEEDGKKGKCIKKSEDSVSMCGVEGDKIIYSYGGEDVD